MENPLCFTPLMPELFNANNFRFVGDFCALTTVSKAFYRYFQDHERQIYVRYILEHTRADLSSPESCSLEELRLLRARYFRWLDLRRLFTINNPNVLKALTAQGLDRVVYASIILNQAICQDSHLMLKALLERGVGKADWDLLANAAKGGSYMCFCLLRETLKVHLDLEFVSMGIELAKSNPYRNISFVLRLLKDFNNFHSLCDCHDRRWIIENILAYPNERTARQIEQYRELIEYVIEEMSSCVGSEMDFMVAAATVSSKALRRFQEKFGSDWSSLDALTLKICPNDVLMGRLEKMVAKGLCPPEVLRKLGT